MVALGPLSSLTALRDLIIDSQVVCYPYQSKKYKTYLDNLRPFIKVESEAGVSVTPGVGSL